MRRSRKKTIFGFIKRWRGLQRYRCRDCAKSFYRPLSPADRPPGDRPEEHQSRSERSAARKKRRRRKIELLVFFGMLIIFYAALRVFTHSS